VHGVCCSNNRYRRSGHGVGCSNNRTRRALHDLPHAKFVHDLRCSYTPSVAFYRLLADAGVRGLRCSITVVVRFNTRKKRTYYKQKVESRFSEPPVITTARIKYCQPHNTFPGFLMSDIIKLSSYDNFSFTIFSNIKGLQHCAHMSIGTTSFLRKFLFAERDGCYIARKTKKKALTLLADAGVRGLRCSNT